MSARLDLSQLTDTQRREFLDEMFARAAGGLWGTNRPLRLPSRPTLWMYRHRQFPGGRPHPGTWVLAKSHLVRVGRRVQGHLEIRRGAVLARHQLYIGLKRYAARQLIHLTLVDPPRTRKIEKGYIEWAYLTHPSLETVVRAATAEIETKLAKRSKARGKSRSGRGA